MQLQLTDLTTTVLFCPQIGWSQQCGGKNSACGKDAADSGLCCPTGSTCKRINEWHWQCDSTSSAPVPTPVPTPGGCQAVSVP